MKRWAEQNSGWVLVIFFCIVAVARWMQIAKFPAPLSDGWWGIASMIGKVGALVGTVLYSINFVLGMRARWLEPLFGGLNRVYIAHHIVGGIALIALCIHPVFLSIRYIEPGVTKSYKDAAMALLPERIEGGSYGDVMTSLAQTFGIVGFYGLVVLLICTFFVKMKYQKWLLTHKLLGPAFFLAALHVIYMWSDVRNDLPLRLYLVIWMAIGLVAYIHRSLLGNIFVRRYRYTVSRVARPNDTTVVIGLEPLQKRVTFKAGQFVFIKFLSGPLKGETHPFSLTSEEGQSHKELELCVKALGDFTTKLQEVKVGDQLLVEGAFGRFSPVYHENKKQLWIAGGVGVTPFISMARSEKNENGRDIAMIHSVNNERELVGRHVFGKVETSLNMFFYHPFIAGGDRGFLNSEYIQKIVPDYTSRLIFICGPPVMMKSLKQQFITAGVPKQNIISEEFSIN